MTAGAASTRLIVSGPVIPLEPGLELTAYRIVQEALTNARRHAPGAAVDVELDYADPRSVYVSATTGRGSAGGEADRRSRPAGHARAGRHGGRPAQRRARTRRASSSRRPFRSIGSVAVIRVVVVDDQEVVRAGFAALLATQPDFAVVGTAQDGAAAVRLSPR